MLLNLVNFFSPLVQIYYKDLYKIKYFYVKNSVLGIYHLNLNPNPKKRILFFKQKETKICIIKN